MASTRTVICEYQNTIQGPPISTQQLYGNATANDKVTVDSWRQVWLSNIQANHKKYGSFKEHSIGKLFGKHQNQPCIVVGSGPSLKINAEKLKKNNGVVVVSCLHNFHFLEDLGVGADYYVSLDAGEVTIEEVSEGGSKSADEYWEMTRHGTLLAYVGSPPKLLEKWQGEVLLFNAPIPDSAFEAEIDKIEKFHTAISTGGNVLGACLYIAKGIFGCNPIVFMGADFSFDIYGDKHRFHAWDSKYDANLGHYIHLTNVFGHKVPTWQSYANFKSWFDFVCCKVPGVWINCTEGGCLGSYPEGNIVQIKYMDLLDFFSMYQMNEHLREQCENPETNIKKVLF